MLSGGKNTLAMAALCMKQRTSAVQNGCVDEAAGVLVSTAEAKAPWKKDEAANGVAVCSKSKARDGLLELLNKSGVPPAAQRMALNILVKLVRPEAGEFETQLFSKILCSLIESKGAIASPLDCLASKYFVYGNSRCCALDRIHQLAKRISEGETRGIGLLKVLYGYLFDKNPSTSACVAATEFEQKAAVAESDKQFLEAFCAALLQAKELKEPGDGSLRSARVLQMPQLTCSVVEEKTTDRCKAGVPDDALQEPEKTMNGEDTSALVLTAARGRGNETNSGSAVKTGTPKKKVSDEDEVEDEEEEEEDGGGESGGDEGDSDDPDHGGNEEEEEGEEEEEEDEDGEEEEEDGGQQQELGSNAAAARSNNVIPSADGAPGFDEEEEEESDQDGGVEDDGDGDDGGGEDEEDDDGEDEEDGAPPKKKAKK